MKKKHFAIIKKKNIIFLLLFLSLFTLLLKMGVRHSRQISSQHTSGHEKRRDSLKQQISKPHSLNSIVISGRQYHAEQSAYALPRDELEQDRLNSVNGITFY